MVQPGDVCTFKQENGAWGLFWVLAVDEEDAGRVYSLSRFNVASPAKADDLGGVSPEELKVLPRIGHFPIAAARVESASPSVIAQLPVTEADLEGYHAWREALEGGRASWFDVPIEDV